MKKKKFRMKQKPVQPKRYKKIERKHTLLENGCPTTVDKLFEDLQLYPLDARIELKEIDERYSYDDTTYYEVTVEYSEPESDEAFVKRMAQYEKRLKAYVEWYEENKDAIKEKPEEEKQIKEDLKRKEIKELEKKLQKLKG